VKNTGSNPVRVARIQFIMATLILIVAQAVAIQCIGYECSRIEYFPTMELIRAGVLELVFEVYGFIKIYRKKE
jgi:hypothetical protein